MSLETFIVANNRAMLNLLREYAYLGYAEPIDWEISACEVEMYESDPFMPESVDQPLSWLVGTDRLFSRMGLAKEVRMLKLRAHSLNSGTATFSQANGVIEIVLGPENPNQFHDRYADWLRKQGDFSKHTYW